MPAGDRKALHEAMHLLPQRLPNVASSGQDVKKSSTEPVKAGNMASDESLDHFRRFMAGDKTMITQLFCNNPSLSPLHEACRATIQRVERSTIVQTKDGFAEAQLKLHNKVLREELLLRADAIREDQARRQKDIKKLRDDLGTEMEFFEENICDSQTEDDSFVEDDSTSRVNCNQS
jgi:hypothetical protein